MVLPLCPFYHKIEKTPVRVVVEKNEKERILLWSSGRSVGRSVFFFDFTLVQSKNNGLSLLFIITRVEEGYQRKYRFLYSFEQRERTILSTNDD